MIGIAHFALVLFKGEVLPESTLVRRFAWLLAVAVVPAVLLLYQSVAGLGLGVAVVEVVARAGLVVVAGAASVELRGALSPLCGDRLPLIYGSEGLAQADA